MGGLGFVRGRFHAAAEVIIAFEEPKWVFDVFAVLSSATVSDVKCTHLSRKCVEHVQFLWHNDGLKPEMAPMLSLSLSLHACQKGGTRGKYQQCPGCVTVFQDPIG